jgi:hypothetical protein
MCVAIIAPGSRGEVEPYLALGKGLKQAGHIVRLVTHQNFEEFVISQGVEFWPVEGSVQDIAQGADMRALLERGNFWMMWQGFRSADRLARREVLGLRAAPFFAPFNANCLQGSPILYGYSPSVIPKPPVWDTDTHVTGYWFLDPAGDWTPPAIPGELGSLAEPQRCLDCFKVKVPIR